MHAVRGWVRSVRSHGKKGPSFVSVSDGLGSQDVQLTLLADEASGEAPPRLGPGSCVWASGRSVERTDGQTEVEVRLSGEEGHRLQLVGACDAATYPLQKKAHTPEYLRTELLHLRPSTRQCAAVTRLRNALAFSLHAHLQAQEFCQVHAPLLTTNDCEGAGEMFRVVAPSDFAPSQSPVSAEAAAAGAKPAPSNSLLPPAQTFFKSPTFLSVSTQLHLEAFASSMPKVYSFGPIFRADPSNTSNHLSEFWMLEPELAFADLSDAMRLCEDLIQSSVSSILANSSRVQDLDTLTAIASTTTPSSTATSTAPFSTNRLQQSLKPFAWMTYSEAVQVLGLEWGADL